jgi:penicillin amidase
MKYINEKQLNADERKYLGIVRKWNRRNDNGEQGVIIFTTWFDSLEQVIWNDELSRQPAPYTEPEQYTLVEALLKDSAFSFVDNINTPGVETIEEDVTAAFKRSVAGIKNAETAGNFSWSKFKDAGIRHLLRMEPLSRFHLNTGGGENVINATKQFHGPSWRMIVQLTDSTEAYGVYPGGQSGNAGSRYYDNFVDDWSAGKYYQLWMMKKGDVHNGHIKYIMHLTNE